ncbi:MAG: hypothetical protein U9P10_08910 [Thermodesulfobacteriota bacterium]|nr:hypothetical protein [Thermodesulfobacteriota bacterium]
MKAIGNSQLIVRVLLSGRALTSNDVSKEIAESEGKTIRAQDTSSILSKISNPEKSNLGFFIDRTMGENAFYYKLKKDALVLSEKQAYGLTLKKGPNCFSVEELKQQFPDLAKHIQPGKKIERPRKRKIVGSKTNQEKVPQPEKEEVASDPKEVASDNSQISSEEMDTSHMLLQKILTTISKAQDININLTVKFDI